MTPLAKKVRILEATGSIGLALHPYLLESSGDELTLFTLDTELGEFSCMAGDKPVPFRHRVTVYDLGEEYGPTEFHEVDID